MNVNATLSLKRPRNFYIGYMLGESSLFIEDETYLYSFIQSMILNYRRKKVKTIVAFKAGKYQVKNT